MLKQHKPIKPKPYWEMTTEELAQATREYDKPIPPYRMRPMTKQERVDWERMRKGPHHSIFISRDPNGIWVRLEPDVLQQALKYANANKLSLSDIINRSVKGMLVMVR